MSGDTNQCEPINSTKSIRHNYFNDSISVAEMCPKRIEMKYIEESTRYDNETRVVLNNFLKYENIRHKFEPIGNYYKNICWLNETRCVVTEDCCNRFVKDKEHHEINFKYKSRIEKYEVCITMPVIATQNMKKRNMFDMMEFKIESINENNEGNLEFVIYDELFSLNVFRESFLPNFCNTVYKYQGSKIDEHYNIFDTHKMELEYIHLDHKKICKRYREREQDNMITINSYFNSDYQNGKIYEVTFELNPNYYVGSTTQLLESQLHEHCNNPKSAIYKYRDDKPKIRLIRNCPCQDKKTLEKTEYSYINEYKQKYGEFLINIKVVKKVTKKMSQFKVEMENQKQFEDRLQKLGYKFRIRDDTIRSFLEIDACVDGKRIKYKRRYNENNKQEAFK